MNVPYIAPEVKKSNPLPYIALATGILALSFSAMFVRWANAPGPVTGLYRVFLSSLLLTPFFIRDYRTKRDTNQGNIIFPILAGIYIVNQAHNKPKQIMK